MRLLESPKRYADRLFGLISNMTGYSVEELRGTKMRRQLVHYRVAAYAVMRDAGYSHGEIADAIGRHHSTIVKALRNRNALDQDTLDELAARLEAG